MIFRRPSLGWAKAKLPARAKPASAEIADRIPHLRASEIRAIPSTRQRVLSEPALQERSDASLSFHIGCIRAHEHPDAPHTLGLLRPRRKRPRRRAAEQRDEGAPLHVGPPANQAAARAVGLPRRSAYHGAIGTSLGAA